MSINYNEIERKWNQKWDDDGIYNVDIDDSRDKFYVLDMFPYPSGAGLHVGHPLGYIASDIYSRYKRMKGFNVLHPMGFDAFGLPAEEYALKTGIHPAISTENNIKRYCEQLKLLGFSFDWNRMLKTCDANYYKWTQWIFTLLFDYYYDTDQDKARPISDLVKIFETSGNSAAHAQSDKTDAFTASQWVSFSRKEKANILMNYRLAYRRIGYVNWCEALGTVLANDQVKDGISERGGHPVEKKAMTQWYLRITSYAERLLNDLDTIEWSDALKTIQSNWIGRSEGATVYFDIADHKDKIEIYTTRPDTIFGATFMVLAPEHPLVKELTTGDQESNVSEYLDYVASRSEVERMAEKKVTGAFIGAYAINPFTESKIPIWISEYVLVDYGTGAIMAVPSDDERDNAFASKYNIPIIDVVDKSDYPEAGMHDKVGKMVNSGFITGMEVKDAIKAIINRITDMGIGHVKVNYKLRDSNFSRQRYWGEPFPITFDDEDIASIVGLKDLPVKLPHTENFKPGTAGQSPLSRIEEWAQPTSGMRRETDTMPAVAGSSWYYLRYMDPHNEEAFASKESINYWQDVDLYVGGSEHAVAHLMYARFWHKFLYDLGYVPTTEPFKKLINQGMIQGIIEFIYLQKEKIDGKNRFVTPDIAEADDSVEWVQIPVHIDFVTDYGSDSSYLNREGIQQFLNWIPEYKGNSYFATSEGQWDGNTLPTDITFPTVSAIGKMSKSMYNVINPDEVVEQYGADCFRMYEMFLGPIEQSKPWDTKGIDGVSKFLKRYISLFFNEDQFEVSGEKATPSELKVLHKTIKKVTDDIERFSFNTCVSAFMVCTNELKKLKCSKRSVLEPLNSLLAPFAPYVAEEIHQLMGESETIHVRTYPAFEEKYLEEDTIEYPICFNGKKRDVYSFSSDMSNDELQQAVTKLEVYEKWTEGMTVRKIIVVPKRMINVVVSG